MKMKPRGQVLLVMGPLSVVLVSLFVLRALGGTPAALPSIIVGWIVAIGAMIAASHAQTLRGAWAGTSLFNGTVSIATVLTSLVVPALAAAEYEPGADWMRNIDLAPPATARLREAIASAYFSIALIIAGMIFFAVAYFVFHRADGSKRHGR